MSTCVRFCTKEIFAVVCILVFGLILRIVHWSPSADGDEARYINHAYALAEGGLPEYFDGAIAVRIPYLAFLVFWGAIFGYTTPALQSSGLATFTVAGLLLWIIARKLYGTEAAHVAAFLFSVLPIHIVLSTHALTDDLGLVFALGAVLMWIAGTESERRLEQQLALCASSGFLAGVATGIRQPFFLLGIILPIGSYLSGTRLSYCLRAAVVFALSAFFYLVVESWAFWTWLGDPLFRLHHDVLHEVTESAMISLELRPPMSVVEKIFAFRGYLPSLLPSGRFGFVPILVGLAVVDRIVRRDKKAFLFLTFLIVLVAYHFWGTTSLGKWSLPPVNPRYLIAPITAGCLLCGAFLSDVHRGYRFNVATILCAVFCTVIVHLWIVAYGGRPNCVTEFAQHLAKIPENERSQLVIPESVKRCFLPKDYWKCVEGMQVVTDEQLAQIERMDLSRVRAFTVPNETFYRYSHIGVVDALERTASWWEKEEVIGEKWPAYLVLTGKPSRRVIGFIYYRADAQGKARNTTVSP